MSDKLKPHELRQKRAKLLDENRGVVEKAEGENRGLTADEKEGVEARFAEAQGYAERISTMERLAAIERNGPEEPGRRSDPLLPHQDPRNAGQHRYSMLRAAACFAQKRAFTGLEAEVSQELEKRTGKSAQGFLMPYSTRGALTDSEKRTLDISLTGSGAAGVQTTLSKDWIELLRNKCVVIQAGATELHDLQGKIALPRQNGAATAFWVAESGAPTGSNQTLDQVPLSPHTIGAFTDITRRFFELANIDSGEAFVKDDLTAILARGADLAALNGPGSTTQPLGILQNTAITATQTVALGTNGGPPTWPAMVELVTIIKRGNAADLGPITYVTNADGEGTLATTPKSSTWPIFLLEDGKCNGRGVISSQQLPNNLPKGSASNLSPIIAGVWNQMILAYWSGVDILVDPYTGSSSGTVRIVALQDMDINVRHPQAFSCVLDLASNQTQ